MFFTVVVLLALVFCILPFLACIPIMLHRKNSIPNRSYGKLWTCHSASKIDAVVLWVDGSDPVWRSKYFEATQRNPSTMRFSAHIGEVVYCVRQLRQQPWINRIFVVTDCQKHAALEDESVIWVDHIDIFPPYVKRPCFNSNVIETFVHRIPTLSEVHLLLNDDFIFNKTVTEDFFTFPDGVLRFNATPWGLDAGMSKFWTLGSEQVSCTMVNAVNTFCEKAGLSRSLFYPMNFHGPVPCTVSGVREALEFLGEDEVRELASHQVRSKSEIQFLGTFWMHFACHKGYARWSCNEYSCQYVWLCNFAWIIRLQLSLVKKREPHILCLNDSRTGGFEKTSLLVKDWLESHFD